MEEAYSRLNQKAARLGKHYERFLIAIVANRDRLVEGLERHNLLDEVDLWTLSPNPGRQMWVVRQIGADESEKMDLMASYYAHQFLLMNLAAMDRLELDLADSDKRNEAYRRFLDHQATNYQRLNAVYIDNLMDLSIEGEDVPEHTMCVVGTRWDQDDVDLLVFHAEQGDADALNKAIGRVVNEFFRRAGRLHLYIAERMGLAGYSANASQYAATLEGNVADFVMICELLSAEPMLGSWSLFASFRKMVEDRVTGRQPRFRRYHEGFMRGLMGEMRSLLQADVHRDRIDFKNDALRLAKGMAIAGKVVHRLTEATPIELLHRLTQADPEGAECYQTLADNLVFVEVFRLLYHMIIVQEDVVELDGTNERLIEEIATIMAMTHQGGVSAGGRLIVHYYDAVAEIRRSCQELMVRLTQHVRKTSAYSYLSNRQYKRPPNVAREIAEAVRVFQGHIFFEDVLEALQEFDGELARTLVADLERLTPARRDAALDSFLAFAYSDPGTLIELMLIIRRVGTVPAEKTFNDMVARYWTKLAIEDGLLPGLLVVYNSEPAVVNRFIEALTRSQRGRLEDLLHIDLWEDEQAEALRQLRKYIWLRTAGSEFYRRVFRRVVDHHPQFIHHLNYVPRLRRYAAGFLAMAENSQVSGEVGQALASYYDVGYLACAIEAINGVPLETYRAAFVEFADTYVSHLYSLAKKLASSETGPVVETRDMFAIFATGGYARAQAFDDDFDLVLILNSDDPDVSSFFKRVSTHMHRELVRRGTIPQYRFSDHFGEFVTRFSEIKHLFCSGRADTVDRTQILGARMLVGNSRFLSAFHEEIVVAHIFSRGREFCEELAREMIARHACPSTLEPENINIKEGPGGLRDIEHVLLMLKTEHESVEPISSNLFRLLAVCDERHARAILRLQECHTFLRRVRDLYRLSVAAEDEIAGRELGIVAQIMGQGNGEDEGDRLFDLVKMRMNSVRELGGSLVRAITGIDI